MEELPAGKTNVPFDIAREKFLKAVDGYAKSTSDLGSVIATLEQAKGQSPKDTARILLNFKDLILEAPKDFRTALKDSGLFECYFGDEFQKALRLFKKELERKEYYDVLKNMTNVPVSEMLAAELKAGLRVFDDITLDNLQNFVNEINLLSPHEVNNFYSSFQRLFNNADFLDKKYWTAKFSNLPVLAPLVIPEAEKRYRELSEWMTDVIKRSQAEKATGEPAKIILKDPNKIEPPYDKPYGTNGEIEIRFFKEGDNNCINTDDIKTRIEFLGRAAAQLNPEKVEEIDKIIQKYIKESNRSFRGIDKIQDDAMNSKDKELRKAFKDMAVDVGIMYLELQRELVKIVRPDKTISKAIKELDETAKKVVEAEGRPTIIHVRADGSFNAQIPKGNRTYPTNDRGNREEKVTPNSVLELAGTIDDKDKVTVQTVFSRASSFSVLKMRKKKEMNDRQRLNYINGEEDVKNLIRLMNVKSGEEIKIHWHTLFTPLVPEKVGGSIIGKFFPAEVRQARDQHRFIEMLNARGEIDIDGKTYKIKIVHTNTSVRDPKKLKGRAIDEATQDRINNRGMVQYIQRQVDAIKKAYPDLTKWLDESCKCKPFGEINFLEGRLKEQYLELFKALGVDDKSTQNPKDAKAIRAKIKEIEEELTKEYAKVSENIREIWTETPLPAVPEKYQQNAHVMYFADVLNMYFSGRHMKEKGYAYLFAAEMHRTNDFADVIEADNCKSAKDRTKDVVDHTRMLLMYENENKGKFLLSTSKDPDVKSYIKEHYQNIRRQGVSLAAIGKNLPGVRGSAQNHPWGGDKAGTDSLIAKWAQIKPSVKTILRFWFRNIVGKNLSSDDRVKRQGDLLLETHEENLKLYNMKHLAALTNKTLALAMLGLLDRKGLKISEKPENIQKAVAEINKVILSDAVMPGGFLKKYNEFLKILHDNNISIVNDMRGEFIVAIVTKNKNLDVKVFNEKSDPIEMQRELKQLEKHCEHLKLAMEELPRLMGGAGDMRAEVEALDSQIKRLEPEREKLAKLVEKNSSHAAVAAAKLPEASLSFAVKTGEKITKQNKTFILYSPDNKEGAEKFSAEISDEKQIQDLKSDGAHLIELTKTPDKTEASYTEPPKGKKLEGSELEILINKMLDEILKKCEPGKYEDIVLSGSNGKMVKLAKELLSQKIAALEKAAPKSALHDHPK